MNWRARWLLTLFAIIASSCVCRYGAKAVTDTYTMSDLYVWLNANNLGYLLMRYANGSEIAHTTCGHHLDDLIKAADSKEYWALELLDAWGNLPSGLLYEHFMDFGNYDQCLSARNELTDGSRYCLSQIPFGNRTTGVVKYVRIGSCLPASCQANDLNVLFNLYFRDLFNVSSSIGAEQQVIHVQDQNCVVQSTQAFTALDWCTISVSICITLLLLIGTLCDYLAARKNYHLHPLLAAYSLRLNMSQLFRITPNKSASHVIPCLHGIRCLSIVWIIVLHDYMLLLISPNINALQTLDWQYEAFSMIYQTGTIAVDTFLFLSGLLLVITSMRTFERTHGKLNVPLFYVHRYLRLTPVLAFAVLIFMTFYRYAGNGPLWSEYTSSYKLCEETWWLTLLYVQNYAAPGKMCLGHAWYLAVDMQLYIIAPILLLALWKWWKQAVSAIIVLSLLFVVGLFTIIMVNHLESFGATLNLGGDNELMRKTYYATHTRAMPWLIGLLFGYYLYRNNGRHIALRKKYIFGGWLFALVAFGSCVFAIYPKTVPTALPMTPIETGIYFCLSRLIWPIALCWLVFACINGYGGPVNTLLSWTFWQPISKLSYCMYVWHLLIEMINMARVKTQTHFSDYDVFLHFWSDFGITLIVSIVIYLAVEAPFCGMEKFIFNSKTKKNIVHAEVTLAITKPTTISQQNLIVDT